MSWLSSLAPIVGTGLGALLAAPTGGMSMGMGALIGGVAGSGVSSALAASEAVDAQKDMNQQNIDQQNATNATQIELANTAHQREIKDLAAAGLNPILSAKYGGSVTPGLTAPVGQSLAPIIQSSAQQARETMLSNQNLMADIAVKKASVLASSAQAISAGEDARRKAMENDVMELEQPGKKHMAYSDSSAWQYNWNLRNVSNMFKALNPFGDFLTTGRKDSYR